MSEVRVRFAPSPTGVLHLGGARTALFNYLYARHCGGKFLLRIEDTDKERSTSESVDAIIAALNWMGLTHDESIVYQSQRVDAHREALDALIEKSAVYRCYCTPQERIAMREDAVSKGRGYAQHCDCSRHDDSRDAPFVWRFRMPRDGEVVFDDLVQGTIRTNNREIEDIVIARQDGSPLYNFVVVVDDAYQRVSHVIRGKDHLTNTPKQIHIYRALGLPEPTFAHLPLILGLSKRLRSAGVETYREEGYTAAGLNNYIARLGWSHGDEEIFTFRELIAAFSLEQVNRSEGSLDMKKAEWVNQQHIQRMPVEDLIDELAPFLEERKIPADKGNEKLHGAIVTMRPRAKNLVDLAASMTFYFVDDDAVEYEEKAVKKFLTSSARERLALMARQLEGVSPWNRAALEDAVKAFLDSNEIGLKEVAQPARVAMVGQGKGPGLYETMEVLGKDATLNRLRNTPVVD